MLLKENDHVLFFGDSITDAGRRANANNNGGLGVGYAAMCASSLAAQRPELNLRFTNVGTSGNRVYDLEARLEQDVLSVAPTLVSILIGINDTWRRYDSNVLSPIEDFRASYHRILSAVHEIAPRMVLVEPFLLPIPDDRVAWREDLDPRIAAVRDLAREFQTAYVPMDGIFAAAACRQRMDYWLPDGVHPTPAGHALIAQHWLQTVTE